VNASTPDNSEIVLHKGGGSTIAGKDGVFFYRAIQLRTFMKLYRKTGLIPTRGVGAKQMLAIATEYTAKTYKNSPAQMDQAIEDLNTWIETMRAALPVTDNRTEAAA